MNRKYNVVTYMSNDDEAKSYRRLPGAFTVSAENPDKARVIVKEKLLAKNYKIRNLNFTPCGKIIAYVGPRKQTDPIEGWRHKRPASSERKI